MKDPLTESYFKTNFEKPMKKNSSQYKNILNHVKSVKSLETAYKSAFFDETKCTLLFNSLKNVYDTIGNVKDKNLSKEVDKIKNAVKQYMKDHNKDVSNITGATIGSVPGGMAFLKKAAGKDYSTENVQFRKATAKIDVTSADSMLKIWKDNNTGVNLHGNTRSNVTSAITKLGQVDAALKQPENKGGEYTDGADRRSQLLEMRKKLVKELANKMIAARNEIIALQNDTVGYAMKPFLMKHGSLK